MTSPSPRGFRRHSRLLIGVIVTSMLTPTAVAPAGAADRLYGPTTREFDNNNGTKTTLGVRGYMDDACLHEDVWCLSDAANFRPEATAHAKVVRELSHMYNGTFHPKRDAQQDPVQWEARPTSGNAWRVDVVVDRPVDLDNFGMMEVKDWGYGGVWGAGVDLADAQLDGYLQSTRSAPYGLKSWRDSELNVRGWAKLYFDHLSDLWCVWADPSIAGNIYFWPADDPGIPHANYQATCMTPDKEKAKERVRRRGRAEHTADVLADATGDTVLPGPPVIFDPVTTTDREGKAEYDTVAMKDRQRATTLQMCYGDGTCETRSIPQGVGSVIFSFSHTFSGTGTYAQTAKIVETGARAVPAATAVGEGVNRDLCLRSMIYSMWTGLDDLDIELVVLAATGALGNVTRYLSALPILAPSAESYGPSGRADGCTGEAYG